MATYLLCGFMGSGKTTVSERLSGEVIAIDLDTLILEKLQIKGFESIAHYVEEEGWEEFRFLEADNLSFLLDSYSAEEKDVVVALGGGAVNELTLPIIEDSKARLVWLNVPFETCWERIKNSSDRPLVYEGKQVCHDIFNKRLRYYKRSEIKVDPDNVKKIQDIKCLEVS